MDQRIIKTKNNLYKGLLITMKNKSFEEIKVSDICKEAHINRSTFYNNFNDKYDLLFSLFHDLEKKLKQKLSQSEVPINIKEYYVNLIGLLLEHLNENINAYSLVVKHNNNNIASNIFHDIILKNIAENIKNHPLYNEEIPSEIITIFYANGVISICLEYIKNPKKYTKNSILKYISKLIPDNLC